MMEAQTQRSAILDERDRRVARSRCQWHARHVSENRKTAPLPRKASFHQPYPKIRKGHEQIINCCELIVVGIHASLVEANQHDPARFLDTAIQIVEHHLDD
jgi:hypothetical protein